MTRLPPARPTTAQRKPRAPKMVPTHVMINAGQKDYAGVPICNECGHLQTHRIHDLNVADEVLEVDRRIVGEGT